MVFPFHSPASSIKFTWRSCYFSAGRENRTPNLLITNQLHCLIVLCQQYIISAQLDSNQRFPVPKTGGVDQTPLCTASFQVVSPPLDYQHKVFIRSAGTTRTSIDFYIIHLINSQASYHQSTAENSGPIENRTLPSVVQGPIASLVHVSPNNVIEKQNEIL